MRSLNEIGLGLALAGSLATTACNKDKKEEEGAPAPDSAAATVPGSAPASVAAAASAAVSAAASAPAAPGSAPVAPSAALAAPSAAATPSAAASAPAAPSAPVSTALDEIHDSIVLGTNVSSFCIDGDLSGADREVKVKYDINLDAQPGYPVRGSVTIKGEPHLFYGELAPADTVTKPVRFVSVKRPGENTVHATGEIKVGNFKALENITVDADYSLDGASDLGLGYHQDAVVGCKTNPLPKCK